MMSTHGYQLVRSAIAPQVCTTIQADALSRVHLSRTPLSLLSHKLFGSNKIAAPHGRAIVPLPMSAEVTDALKSSLRALGMSAIAHSGLTASAELSELAAMIVLPGTAAQPPHTDLLPDASLSMATLFCALQDTTVDMGATVLFPASPKQVLDRRDWKDVEQGAASVATFGTTYGPDGEADQVALARKAVVGGLNQFDHHVIALNLPRDVQCDFYGDIRVLLAVQQGDGNIEVDGPVEQQIVRTVFEQSAGEDVVVFIV